MISSRYPLTNDFEWCARALGLPSPNTYSPNTLASMVEFLNNFKRE